MFCVRGLGLEVRDPGQGFLREGVHGGEEGSVRGPWVTYPLETPSLKNSITMQPV